MLKKNVFQNTCRILSYEIWICKTHKKVTYLNSKRLHEVHVGKLSRKGYLVMSMSNRVCGVQNDRYVVRNVFKKLGSVTRWE